METNCPQCPPNDGTGLAVDASLTHSAWPWPLNCCTGPESLQVPLRSQAVSATEQGGDVASLQGSWAPVFTSTPLLSVVLWVAHPVPASFPHLSSPANPSPLSPPLSNHTAPAHSKHSSSPPPHPQPTCWPLPAHTHPFGEPFSPALRSSPAPECAA